MFYKIPFLLFFPLWRRAFSAIPVSHRINAANEIFLIVIEDSFKNIVVTKDSIKLRRDKNGIVTMSIYDILLKESSYF